MAAGAVPPPFSPQIRGGGGLCGCAVLLSLFYHLCFSKAACFSAQPSPVQMPTLNSSLAWSSANLLHPSPSSASAGMRGLEMEVYFTGDPLPGLSELNKTKTIENSGTGSFRTTEQAQWETPLSVTWDSDIN